MDDLSVSVCKLGEVTLQEIDLHKYEDMYEVLKCLDKKGYVVLHGVAFVKENWDEGIQDFSNNRYVRTIMDAGRIGGFTICQYEAARAGLLQKTTIPMTWQPPNGPKSPILPKFTGFAAFFLGGESSWFIDVETEEMGYLEPVEKKVYCKGGDIFLCDTRVSYMNPVPIDAERRTANVVRILYIARDFI